MGVAAATPELPHPYAPKSRLRPNPEGLKREDLKREDVKTGDGMVGAIVNDGGFRPFSPGDWLDHPSRHSSPDLSFGP